MSGILPVRGLPGMRAAKTVTSRVITRGGMQLEILPVGKIIAGACSRDPSNTVDVTRLRAGLLMGKISTVVNSLGTVGYYAPSILGVTTNAEAVGSTSIQASAAVCTELARRCGSSGTFTLTGPGSAGGVVVSETVTYSGISGTDITVTAISNNFVAGSFIQPTDGTEDLLTFIPSGTPVAVTDADSSNLNIPFAELPIAGIIDPTMFLPVWPSDTSLREYIVSRLNRASGGQFIFNHTY